MSTLLTESIIKLSEVAATFPATRGGGRTNPSTVFRWCTKGTRRTDGRIIRLEHFRVGNRIMTTREAVARYIAELSDSSVDSNQTVRSPSQIENSAERAGEILKKAGA